MPRGGHKGLLYPVSGVLTNVFGRKRKRGLYHHCTSEIFRPRWGPVKQPSILNDLNLLKWNDGTVSNAEMLPSKNVYDRDARQAWPKPRSEFVSSMYYRNEQRYLKPAMVANTESVRNYLYNILDPLNKKRRGFIGSYLDTEHTLSSQHISTIVNSENDSSMPKINLELPKISSRFVSRDYITFRLRRLEGLISQSDTWRTISQDRQSSSNPFPHVNEGASLVRNLAVSEILYTRSNHRLGRRAHPKWYTSRYRKFVKKRELRDKLNQLQFQTPVE